jgi:group I intron endonuclease
VDLARRLRQYSSLGFLKKELVKNNSIIYKALLKYGYLSFNLDILEYCDKDSLIEREQYYLDMLNPTYNICKKAGSSLGRIVTTETRERLRAARLFR